MKGDFQREKFFVSDLPPNNADNPSDLTPGDDFESQTNALTAQLDRITAETNEFKAKRQLEDHAVAVRKPLHAMLERLGFEQAEWCKHAERVLGGLQSFRLNESGELEILYAGEWMLSEFVLPDDPRLAGLLKQKSATRSDASKLQREIDQTESR